MSSPQEMMRDSALVEVGYTPSSDKLNRYAEYHSLSCLNTH